MRGKRARQIRKEVYRDDMSPRHRAYQFEWKGPCRADGLRHVYQLAKKAWVSRKALLEE